MTGLLADVLGWTGAAVLLVAYATVTRDPAEASARRYTVLNTAGAAGLAVNGAVHAAWPSVVLNLLWLAFGLTAMTRRRRDASTTLPTGRQPAQ
jgi:hypothetical protein